MSKRSRARWSPYWLVLALVAVSYLACASQTTPNPSSVALVIQLVTIAVTLQAARVRFPIRRALWVVIAVAVLAIILGSFWGLEGGRLDIVLSAGSMLAYLAAPIAILRDEVSRRVVDLQSLVAVVSAYLMLGMAFTFAYNLIGLVTQVPTFGADAVDSLSSQLFFSFTTLTTTGYGNVVPVAPAVQSLAILEALTGQLFLVLGVARIVNVRWKPDAEPAPTKGQDS